MKMNKFRTLSDVSLFFNMTSKFDADEKFAEFKNRIKKEHDIAKKYKGPLKILEDTMTKIKEYKSEKPLEYLKAMAQLAKCSVSKDKNERIMTVNNFNLFRILPHLQIRQALVLRISQLNFPSKILKQILSNLLRIFQLNKTLSLKKKNITTNSTTL